MKTVFWRSVGIATCVAVASAAQAQVASVLVSARANIYAAGHAFPEDPGGGGAGEMPPIIAVTQAAPSLLLVSAVVGTVSTDGAKTWHGAFGASNGLSLDGWRGLSGVLTTFAMGSLAGVFLDHDEPVDPAPPALPFDNTTASNRNQYPQLRQVFLVSGTPTIRYRVPLGATRLALGFVDTPQPTGHLQGSYSDNEGVLQVLLDIGPLTAVQPVTWGAIKDLYRR